MQLFLFVLASLTALVQLRQWYIHCKSTTQLDKIKFINKKDLYLLPKHVTFNLVTIHHNSQIKFPLFLLATHKYRIKNCYIFLIKLQTELKKVIFQSFFTFSFFIIFRVKNTCESYSPENLQRAC